MLNKQKQQSVIDYNEILLEVTNICNFNCIFCVNDVMKRKKGFMDVDLFKRLVDEISQSKKLKIIFFHVMGEPLLHNNIIEMINYATKRTFRQILITNASCLRSEKRIRELLDSGLTNLDISYYCKNEEEFKMRNAKNLTFHDYKEIIKKIIITKYKYGYGTHLRLYLFNRDFSNRNKIFESSPNLIETHEIEYHINYWKKFIDELRKTHDIDIEMKGLHTKMTKKKLTSGFGVHLTKDFEISIKPLSPWLGSQDKNYKKAIFGKCKLVLSHEELAVLWNGDVVLCCGDFDGGTKVGNVRDKTLQDVINGDKMREVERKFKVGIIPFEICKTCLGGKTYREWFKKQIGTYVGNIKPIRPIFNKLQGKIL